MAPFDLGYEAAVRTLDSITTWQVAVTVLLVTAVAVSLDEPHLDSGRPHRPTRTPRHRRLPRAAAAVAAGLAGLLVCTTALSGMAAPPSRLLDAVIAAVVTLLIPSFLAAETFRATAHRIPKRSSTHERYVDDQ